jgi:hypothetical protein
MFKNNVKQIINLRRKNNSLINNLKIKKSFSTLFNEELFLRNKEFAANFKDSVYQKVFYDINLQNTLNSLFLINREIKNIVFVGPNPALFLEKLPPSNYILFK